MFYHDNGKFIALFIYYQTINDLGFSEYRLYTSTELTNWTNIKINNAIIQNSRYLPSNAFHNGNIYIGLGSRITSSGYREISNNMIKINIVTGEMEKTGRETE